jgi:hypothetical protein
VTLPTSLPEAFRRRSARRTSGGRSRPRSTMRWRGPGWIRDLSLAPAVRAASGSLLDVSESGGRDCASRDRLSACPARKCAGGRRCSPPASRQAACWLHP